MKAFPHNKHFSEQHTNDFMNGMDLRDWFAGLAMHAILADPEFALESEKLANAAYHYADGMMAQRIYKQKKE